MPPCRKSEREQVGLNRRVDDALARASVTFGNGTDEYLERSRSTIYHQDLFAADISNGQRRLKELAQYDLAPEIRRRPRCSPASWISSRRSSTASALVLTQRHPASSPDAQRVLTNGKIPQLGLRCGQGDVNRPRVHSALPLMLGSSVLFDMVRLTFLDGLKRAGASVPPEICKKLIGLALVLTLGAPVTASAVTAEVARACDAVLAKAFPPKQIGNPAAGSSRGRAKERREYYNKCVANNGKVDDVPADTPQGQQS